MNEQNFESNFAIEMRCGYFLNKQSHITSSPYILADNICVLKPKVPKIKSLSQILNEIRKLLKV